MSRGKHWTDFRVYKTLLKKSLLFIYLHMIICVIYILLNFKNNMRWFIGTYKIEQNNKN